MRKGTYSVTFAVPLGILKTTYCDEAAHATLCHACRNSASAAAGVNGQKGLWTKRP